MPQTSLRETITQLLATPRLTWAKAWPMVQQQHDKVSEEGAKRMFERLRTERNRAKSRATTITRLQALSWADLRKLQRSTQRRIAQSHEAATESYVFCENYLRLINQEIEQRRSKLEQEATSDNLDMPDDLPLFAYLKGQ